MKTCDAFSRSSDFDLKHNSKNIEYYPHHKLKTRHSVADIQVSNQCSIVKK